MPNERTRADVDAANPFVAWLVRRMAERGFRNNHLASAMSAKGLDVSKSMVSSYRSGGSLPDPETSDKLADFFGDERAVVWGYVRAAREQRDAASADPTTPDESTRELIRETVHETLAQMGHPRVAATPGLAPDAEEIAMVFDAVIAALPEEYRATLHERFRDGMRGLRRRILAET